MELYNRNGIAHLLQLILMHWLKSISHTTEESKQWSSGFTSYLLMYSKLHLSWWNASYQQLRSSALLPSHFLGCYTLGSFKCLKKYSRLDFNPIPYNYQDLPLSYTDSFHYLNGWSSGKELNEIVVLTQVTEFMKC